MSQGQESVISGRLKNFQLLKTSFCGAVLAVLQTSISWGWSSVRVRPSTCSDPEHSSYIQFA